MVEPAILKAVQGVEQRHVEKANHLSNGINGEETNNHTLNEEECLEEEVKEHVCDDLTDAGERLRFTSRHFKRQVSYILKPDGVDYLAEDEQGENPESTED